jgi:hypothetical protein
MALGPTEAAGAAYWGVIKSDPRPVYEEICGFSLAFLDRYLTLAISVLARLEDDLFPDIIA